VRLAEVSGTKTLIDFHVRPGRAYEYYNPERQGFSGGYRLSVAAKK
jgi:hypothetical protein